MLSGGSESSELAVDAVNRRGKHIARKVTCSPLRSEDGARPGVILMMKTIEPE